MKVMAMRVKRKEKEEQRERKKERSLQKKVIVCTLPGGVVGRGKEEDEWVTRVF